MTDLYRAPTTADAEASGQKLETIIEEKEQREFHGEILMKAVFIRDARVSSSTSARFICPTESIPYPTQNATKPLRLRDYLGGINEYVTVSSDGVGLFPCPEHGTAVWVVHNE